LIDVVMMALDGEGSKGVYHISSGRDYAIKELFDETVRSLGVTLENDVEIRPRGIDDAYTILLDQTKTNKDFGWKASTPLKTGVRAAIEYYKKYGVEETYTHLKVSEEKE